MEKEKQPISEENINLRLVQESVNLSEYAGDTEDDQLACQQANEYITDCERKLMGQLNREEGRRNVR